MRENITKILENKKKIILFIMAIILPIIVEFLIFEKIEINKSSIIRMGFIYGIYGLIIVFKLLMKIRGLLKKIADNLIKYRYLLAVIILFILVLMQVNFSSIDMWATYMQEPEYANTIFGEARPIRSDEWLTQSPFMLGQTISDEQNIHNENIAQGNMNMLMITSPIKDIVSISRPLTWGLLFLGEGYGFSFYWVLKVIALIMLSIEIMLKITKKDSLLSLTGGLMLGLAPAMMWWLSTAVVDGYIYGMAVVILFSYYMQNLHWKIWKKIAIAIGMVICIPGFAFVLYPAFQVPFAFLMAVIMMSDLLKHRKELKKVDYAIMFGAIVGTGAIILRFVLLCLEDIKVMMSTVYPGARFETGGTFTIDGFIGYFANIFFPYSDGIGNTCEPSSYIYPFMGLIITSICFVNNYIKNRKSEKIENKKQDSNDKLIIALVILYVIFLIWEYIGFPKILAQISFLYFAPEKRVHIILGMIGTILTICMLQKMKKKEIFNKLQANIISALIVSFSYVLIRQSSIYAEFFTLIKLEIISVVIYAMTYFLLRGKKEAWCYTMCIVAIMAGLTVNPVTVGLDSIYKTKSAIAIQEIKSEDKEALWIGQFNINGQYLVANGVNCLNGVNIYPNFKWLRLADPEGIYDEVYNRFAHISIDLGYETHFTLLGTDSYQAILTYENIKDIGIKYYYRFGECSDEIMEKFNMTLEYEDREKGQFIYKFD